MTRKDVMYSKLAKYYDMTRQFRAEMRNQLRYYERGGEIVCISTAL